MMKKLAAILLSGFLGCQSLQAQDRYRPLDAGSEITFTIRNFGLKTEGRFRGLKGIITFNPAMPGASEMNVSVEAATINTGNSQRDKDLKASKYFDVARYPVLRFESTGVKAAGKGFYTIWGNLTIKGVTRPLRFDFKALPGQGGYLFEGSFEINRLDYGVGGNSMSLQDRVKVHLSVLAVK